MTATNSTTSAFLKEIRYDRSTKDFALYLNGELIGYSGSFTEGESRLNELVYDLLRRASHADISDLIPEDAEVALEVIVALAGEIITENSEIEESVAVVAEVDTPMAKIVAATVTETTTYINTPIDALARTMVILSRNWQRAIRAGRYDDAKQIEAHEQAVRNQFRLLSHPSLSPMPAAHQHPTTSRRINY